tara:strand:- start:215 stop:553 length:339 start_codon:yes stop_codon:yes gene_type:complete
VVVELDQKVHQVHQTDQVLMVDLAVEDQDNLIQELEEQEIRLQDQVLWQHPWEIQVVVIIQVDQVMELEVAVELLQQEQMDQHQKVEMVAQEHLTQLQILLLHTQVVAVEVL